MLLSAIYGVPSIGIHRAKNQSSSSQQGLRLGTKNEGFLPKIQMRRFGETGLGGVLETSFDSSTL